MRLPRKLSPIARSMPQIPATAVLAALAVLTVLAAACSASGGGDAFGPTDDERNTIAVVERFAPATAALSVVVENEQMLPLEEGSSELQGVMPELDAPPQRSSGSGFLIERDGERYLVSNFHVVQATLVEGTSDAVADSSITAEFPEAVGRFPVEVVGVNPSFDLALLRATDRPFPELEIPFGDSDDVRKGQKAIAIGNPFGFDATVTVGIVSNIGRFVQSIGDVPVPMIQTDAATNPGNSGGALLNSAGELIGINTSIFNPDDRSFAGIGFSVPSNLVLEALDQLVAGGVSDIADTRPSFGARLGNLAQLPAPVREQAGLPETGVAVLDVIPGGAADQAGFRVPEFEVVGGLPLPIDPDVVIAIDGRTVSTSDNLNLRVSYESEFGDVVEFTILRDGREETIEVAFTEG